MKKSIFAIALAMLCSSLIFTGCSSIPEPKTAEDNLLYGNVNFNFSCIPNNYGIPTSSTKKDGIEVNFQNIKTKRIIKMTTNHNGEFLRKNIPDGTYIMRSLKAKVNYGNGYESEYKAEFDRNSSNFYFVSLANSVINMGVIDLDISITDMNYYSCRVEWDKDFSEAYYKFSTEHPTSTWLDKDWYNRAETAE